MSDRILIRRARQNNLKGFDLELPHNALIVVMGPSGSGKSSLAFDTLYAEGQRRFIESQSAYSRQFLQRLDKPAVDAIDGLPPTIAVHSKNSTRSSRSTVGTTTEIHDHLRLLFAKVGRLHCPRCGDPAEPMTLDEMADDALRRFSGRKAFLLFPIALSDKVDFPLFRELARARGYSHALLNGERVDLETAADDHPAFARGGPPEAFVVVDRLNVDAKKRGRLVDGMETALKGGDGVCRLQDADGGDGVAYSEKAQCVRCGVSIRRPQPMDLSFNSPVGACETCLGFGDVYAVDEALVVPDRTKTILEGAVEPFYKPRFRAYLTRHLKRYGASAGFRLDAPYDRLTGEELGVLWKGGPNFMGILPFFERLKAKSYKPQNRFFLKRYQSLKTCGVCGGARIKPEGLAARVGGKSIHDLCTMNLNEFDAFFRNLRLAPHEEDVARIILGEIRGRAEYLVRIGLGYLTPHRLARTLSGGEMERIHLAGYLGSRLTGTLYVLDEPTVGLHSRDTDRLLSVLKSIRDCGNTVIVVEHDLQAAVEADQIVELGPGSGERGGEVMYSGDREGFEKQNTLTAQYVLGGKRPARKKGAASGKIGGWLELRGAREHNLQNLNVRFPINRLTCVTGVSGSGKSALVCDVLYPALSRKLGKETVRVGEHDGLKGWEAFSDVKLVDQDPIARTPRSNPASFMDFFTPIRMAFANSEEARRRGLAPGHFSFNSPLGRCERCGGDGSLKIDMQFLADAYVVCDACDGGRFRGEALKARLQEKTIVDVLNMTADEAFVFFAGRAPILQRLKLMRDVGLGYLRIGQPVNTLSGGEAQRLKIAAELAAPRAGATLYLFDEPTTGLHPAEIQALLECLDRLLLAGHTAVVIEHNLDAVAEADHIIDLGPEGGPDGGRVMACGSPSDVMKCGDSVTGQCLKRWTADRVRV